MTTVVLTDSTAYIPEHARNDLNIHMVPLNVIFGEETYREEIDITTEEFYEKVKETEELPKTSQPSVGAVMEKLEELKENYDDVIAITLSSGISGTYQAMHSAGNMVEGIRLHLFDSEISCLMQGFYALEASRCAQGGEPPEEIMKRLGEMKQSMSAYFIVDDLRHLARGGRLNGSQAFIGSMLQVKPILHFVDTKIVPFEKIRTYKKARKRTLELFDEAAADGSRVHAAVIHANRPAEARAWKQEIEKRYENVTVTISHFGPVIGTHLGEGAMGLGWYKE
ncbi:DegV family protein [Salimicrobium flavidum]|uniref:EDD domain protein, DegV family n=1 Tax=Salimicrobium flavidum TaxID=570947 RepID=A0A1N7J0Y3_9BACI|nr:DegV family protein [Salimicrobium flavidum]SIS42944.1 EDD domain protein, DegV family [Salimicrobium flavidum]